MDLIQSFARLFFTMSSQNNLVNMDPTQEEVFRQVPAIQGKASAWVRADALQQRTWCPDSVGHNWKNVCCRLRSCHTLVPGHPHPDVLGHEQESHTLAIERYNGAPETFCVVSLSNCNHSFFLLRVQKWCLWLHISLVEHTSGHQSNWNSALTSEAAFSEPLGRLFDQLVSGWEATVCLIVQSGWRQLETAPHYNASCTPDSV